MNGRTTRYGSTSILVLVLACAAPRTTSPPAIPAGTDQGNRSLGGSVFTPFSGVVCDRQGGWCADAWGLSMGLTKEYLGADAEARLLEATTGNPDMSTLEFTLSNGVRCNTEKRRCVVKGTNDVEPITQQALFQ
jgi:hypothetical protein